MKLSLKSSSTTIEIIISIVVVISIVVATMRSCGVMVLGIVRLSCLSAACVVCNSVYIDIHRNAEANLYKI